MFDCDFLFDCAGYKYTYLLTSFLMLTRYSAARSHIGGDRFLADIVKSALILFSQEITARSTGFNADPVIAGVR